VNQGQTRSGNNWNALNTTSLIDRFAARRSRPDDMSET
jgi:hypothetical protein